ncbi:MFS transporter [Aeoliella sp. ICT_H6.2]|uniref:MFS transporter n=1 Tax=Aeoliella straminimaris TaxID=2954799 RepID=A0A9X2JJE6_9BACT|nr:MFS transporter [Aeoliella straminimaris]MCO6047517.1 MFS transporter [Aeoliella straminimaris]
MNSVQLRLQIMMFLQFFVWGAWFVMASQVLGANGLNDFVAGTYSSAPIAAMIAPLFLGLIADRFFPSERVMGLLFLIGGGLMLLVPGLAAAKNGNLMVWVFIGHMLCYMPTLGLSNTIAFSNISDQNEFPKIRVWGTIGWIVAGLLVSYLGWDASFNIFWLAGISSLVMGVFSFTLPHTPPPAKGKPADFRTVFMVDAFKMFANVPFAIFMLCSTLICIPLAYYYQRTPQLLAQLGFDAVAATMTLGQMSEIIFMILIPFFFRRLGVKWMIMVGMAAWVLRYVLFAYGAPNQIIWMALVAVALHGICYDFFFVTGFMYTDQKAPNEVRGQAQSMLVFFTQGVGMFFGAWIAGAMFNKQMTSYETLNEAIAANETPKSFGFFEQFTQMFTAELPTGIDPELLSETMNQWKSYWLVPAGMAAAILVLFALTFFDRKASEEAIEAVEEEGAH